MNYIVVGASSGIGYEVAKLLIAQGHHVGVAARRVAPLQVLKNMAPDRVVVAAIDVNTPQAPQQLQELIAALGGMDVYLHSSGVGYANPELKMDKELEMTKTNVVGFTQMIDEAYHYFVTKGRGGHVAAITSIAGTKGIGLAPAYSATKRYQNTYLQALAQLSRQQRHGIAITDIRPGFVDTPLLAQKHYPAVMDVAPVARAIVRALHQRQRVCVIDWKYRLLVAIWHCLPRTLWERLPLRV